MSLSWPWALTALLAFPLLLGLRWWTRRRRRREAVRLSTVTLVRAALPGRSLWRRRIPIWLFAAGLVVLATGAARPQASVPVPSNKASILLAIDVSVSMCSTDVEPNRITAAQNAAREFIQAQHGSARIGLVTFAGIAGVLVPPTTDKKALLSAIDSLRTGRGTAIGLAILTSIDAIAESNPDVPPTGVAVGGGPASSGGADPTGPSASPGLAATFDDFEPDTIVVLTDGRNTHGVDPVTAAGEAAARHVRIYTIGFGTPQPAPMVCEPNQMNGDNAFRGDNSAFGPPGGYGGYGRGYQQIDKETLNQVADLTGGEYYEAENARALSDVLMDLPASISLQRQDIELTFWFALAGAIFVLVAVGLSQWWNRTIPLPARPLSGQSPAPG
jgi:Ca-activated chloride channel family protein